MYKRKKIVALIPLRKGSKSIPHKNIKIIAGKPLFYWVLEELLHTKYLDDIYISTDDPEVVKLSERFESVKILKRPAYLSMDTTPTEEVMIHFSQTVEYDVLVTVQATNPFLTSEDLTSALELFFHEGYDSMLSGVITKRFYWNPKTGEPLNYDYRNRPRRQEFDGIFMENGAFYITKREILLSTRNRLGGKIGFFSMPVISSFEIDEPEDWDIVEYLLTKYKKGRFLQKIKKIKLVVVDADGTLTDGGMYYTKNGEFAKKFNTRDGKGLELLRERGIKVALITSENSEITLKRMEKLNVDEVYMGVKDKLSVLSGIARRSNIGLDEILYMGDDVNDMQCLQSVGFSACPADAVYDVKLLVDYVCQKNGGEGAVREICDLILKSGFS